MGRSEERERARAWHRLTPQDQACVVFIHGLEAVPKSDRWRWVPPGPEGSGGATPEPAEGAR